MGFRWGRTVTGILVLSRSGDVQGALHRHLRFRNFSARTTRSRRTTSAVYRGVPFSIVLSSQNYGVPSTKVPFVILSTRTSVSSTIRTMHGNTRSCLAGPVSVGHLLRSVRHAVSGPTPTPTYTPTTTPTHHSHHSHGVRARRVVNASPRVRRMHRLVSGITPYRTHMLVANRGNANGRLITH